MCSTGYSRVKIGPGAYCIGKLRGCAYEAFRCEGCRYRRELRLHTQEYCIHMLNTICLFGNWHFLAKSAPRQYLTHSNCSTSYCKLHQQPSLLYRYISNFSSPSSVSKSVSIKRANAIMEFAHVCSFSAAVAIPSLL